MSKLRFVARILIIEDDLDTLKTLCLFLRDEGHRCFAKNDAPSALKFLETTEVDLILLDLYLPSISGWDFLKLNKKPIPTIVMTAGVTIAPLPADTTPHLFKPFNLEELSSLINSNLRTRENADSHRHISHS